MATNANHLIKKNTSFPNLLSIMESSFNRKDYETALDILFYDGLIMGIPDDTQRLITAKQFIGKTVPFEEITYQERTDRAVTLVEQGFIESFENEELQMQAAMLISEHISGDISLIQTIDENQKNSTLIISAKKSRDLGLSQPDSESIDNIQAIRVPFEDAGSSQPIQVGYWNGNKHQWTTFEEFESHMTAPQKTRVMAAIVTGLCELAIESKKDLPILLIAQIMASSAEGVAYIRDFKHQTLAIVPELSKAA